VKEKENRAARVYDMLVVRLWEKLAIVRAETMGGLVGCFEQSASTLHAI